MGDARLTMQNDSKNGENSLLPEYGGTAKDPTITLRRSPIFQGRERFYKVIVVDAFSSDAIPIHLITREALELYFDKLADDGILAIHISNRYLDLGPILANLAAELKVKCIKRYDSEIEDHPGKCITDWVLLARHDSDFGDIALDISPYPDEDRPSHADDSAHWHRLSRRPDLRLWTDDFSNILGVFNR